jgi:O-antigen/teichoic acid export membrane protein
MLLHRIGLERFGVLTLVWALVGYAGVFDFGLGRALTKLMAERLGQGNRAAIVPLLWTGISLMMAAGAIASVLLLLVAPWAVQDVLQITPALADETRAAFQVVALGIPFVTLAAGLRGVVEAHQRFRAIALINGILGAFTFLGPLLIVLTLTDDLAAMAAAILLARVAAAALFLLYCVRLHPDLGRPRWVATDLRPLVGFGGWMTVSNLVGPIMDNMDRFLLGALAPISAVAYYATPFDVATRALLIPIALTGVLFPAFSAALPRDKTRAGTLFASATRYVFLAVAPISLLLATFAREGLTLWMGALFATRSERIVQWLAAGILMSALSKIPYALIQASGRPNQTALAHVSELPLYLIAAWLLIRAHGADGAAMAWTLRVTLDSLILFYLASRQLPGMERTFAALAWWVAGALGALCLISLAEPPLLRTLAGGLSLACVFVAARVWILHPGEIRQLRSHFTGPGSRS